MQNRPESETGTAGETPAVVKIEKRLIGRVGVREWGLPSLCVPGKIWRSEEKGTISCMLAHPTDPTLVKTDTLPLEIVEAGGVQWMPDEWRAAIWEYVQAWPSSGCGYGPFVAVTEEQRCHFIRQMAKDLVLSDNIGCRSIAHDVGQFASLDFEIQEVPAGPPGLVCRAADEMILTAEDINLCLGSEELLPCPFCGASAMSHGERTPNGKAICWRITCTGMRPLVPDCAASVWGTHPELDKARAMAVRRWNRRDREGIIMDETPESKTGTAGVSSEPMHDWFSLSYASYLVIPRTILQSCTPENQQRLVDALDAIYDETQANMEEQWPHEAVIEVKLKDSATGRYRKDDLADYQRGRRRLWHDPTLAPR